MNEPVAKPEPLAQAAAIVVGAVRVGLGAGILAFTRPALGKLGFERPDGATVALARLAGMRDVALGAHALAVTGDRERLREATLLGILVDAGDAVSFGAALVSRDGIDKTAAKNVPVGAAAAIAGAWILSRL